VDDLSKTFCDALVKPFNVVPKLAKDIKELINIGIYQLFYLFVRQRSRGFTTSPPLSHHFQHMGPPITLSEVHPKLI
jgi:hypothetical protein